MDEGPLPKKSTEQLGQVEDLLGRCLELPTEQQEAALEDLAKEHPELAQIMREAYAAVRKAGLVGDGEPGECGGPGAPDDPGGEPATRVQIEGLQILERLGSGGMGEVFLAHQLEPVKRKVAVKLVRRAMRSERILARFESERQALARMSHPCIAQVFGAGTTQDGAPYFLMEYVPGTPIQKYCDQNQLTIEDRLDLFVKVCEGVQHAHQKGIIHRDLKPSNILVVEIEDKPMVKIIDFGIAKATEEKLSSETFVTEAGAVVGTPEYMSPEQAGEDPGDLDTRTDVYSLGVVLYELLVGALPFDAMELRRLALHQIVKILQETLPPKPSTKLETLLEISAEPASKRRATPTSLSRKIRGDLDWITMKAMEKDRNRRYVSAAELASDIERYRTNEPVLAGPPSAGYRLKKLLRRHRGSVASALALFVTLLAGLLASLLFAAEANTERQRAQDRAQTIQDIASSVVLKLNPMIRDIPGAFAARQYLVDRSLEFLESFERDPDCTPSSRLLLAQCYLAVAEVKGVPGEPSRHDKDQALLLCDKALALCKDVRGSSPVGELSTELIYDLSMVQARAHEYLGKILSSRADYRRSLASFLDARSPYEQVVSMQTAGMQSTARDVELDLVYVDFHIGESLSKCDEHDKAIDKLLKVVSHTKGLLSKKRGDSGRQVAAVRALQYLGSAYVLERQLEEGFLHFESSWKLGATLWGKHPREKIQLQVMSWIPTELFMHRQLRPELSERAFELLSKQDKLLQQLHEADPGDIAAADSWQHGLHNLALAAKHAGHHDVALEKFREAVKLYNQRKRRGMVPEDSRLTSAVVLRAYSSFLAERGKLEEAVRLSRRVLPEFRELVELGKDNSAGIHLGECLRFIGTWLILLGQHDDGLMALRESVDVFRALRDADRSFLVRKSIGFTLIRIAEAQASLDTGAHVEAGWQEAVDEWQALVDVYKEDLDVLDILAITLFKQTEYYHKVGNERRVHATSRRVIELRRTAADKENATVSLLRGHAWFLLNSLAEELRDPVAAVKYAERAAAMTKRQNWDILDVLSLAHEAAGNKERAALAIEETLSLMRYLKSEGAEKVQRLQARLRRLRAKNEEP